MPRVVEAGTIHERDVVVVGEQRFGA